MKQMEFDVVVVGGGPAGLAAAVEASMLGVKVLVIERNSWLGGILRQCIHNGFGLKIFNEDYTGPEYAQKYIDEIKNRNIEFMLESTVLNINKENVVTVSNSTGLINIKSKSIVLAMGCREKTREQIMVCGDRPAGVYTAGLAQKYLNVDGLLPGKKIVIVGSGDIGMIMARRFTLEGAQVKAVVELMPYMGGLIRNKVQCLEDYNIPLLFNTKITKIFGKDRVKNVEIVNMVNGKEIESTKRKLECDTIIFSTGLIPENELSECLGLEICEKTLGPIINSSMETSKKGIFAAGNVVTPYDLVDQVTMNAMRAGKNAALFALNNLNRKDINIEVFSGKDVKLVVPQKIDCLQDVNIYFRSNLVSRKKDVVLIVDGRIVERKILKIIRPSEMESIKINSEQLRNLDGKKIKIELVDKI